MVDENKSNENIIEENENIGWTWATCTKCGKMYMFYDKKGIYNDDFPRIICPQCKAKSTRKKNEALKKHGSPDKFLKENNITDVDVIKEFKAIYSRNTRRRYETILRDAIQIAQYRKEEKQSGI